MKIEFRKSAIREYKKLTKKNKSLAERMQFEILSITTNNNEAKGKYKIGQFTALLLIKFNIEYYMIFKNK